MEHVSGYDATTVIEIARFLFSTAKKQNRKEDSIVIYFIDPVRCRIIRNRGFTPDQTLNLTQNSDNQRGI